MEVIAEKKKAKQPKRTPLMPKALEGADAMDVDKTSALLKPKGKGVQKPQSGRKVGKKTKILLHVSKNTKGKKKAKRRSMNESFTSKSSMANV